MGRVGRPEVPPAGILRNETCEGVRIQRSKGCPCAATSPESVPITHLLRNCSPWVPEHRQPSPALEGTAASRRLPTEKGSGETFSPMRQANDHLGSASPVISRFPGSTVPPVARHPLDTAPGIFGTLPIDLVYSGGICSEKLLPDLFRGPVHDGGHQSVQDFVPSVVVHKFDAFMFVQLRDHVSRRIEVDRKSTRLNSSH